MTSRVSTNKLLALKALNHGCEEESVAWAIGRLEAGATERHVLMLAGMSPPFNFFEMAALRDAALEELGIQPLSRTDAVRVLAAEIARDVLSGRAEWLPSLRMLNRLYLSEGELPELQNLYLLYYAWEDLLTSPVQWYWSGATTPEEVQAIVRDELEQLVRNAEESGLLGRD